MAKVTITTTAQWEVPDDEAQSFASEFEQFGTEVPPPRTEPPKRWVHHRYHWLDAERAGGPSVAEWLAGSWYCANEIGPVLPEEMARRGWQWLAPAIPPSRTRAV